MLRLIKHVVMCRYSLQKEENARERQATEEKIPHEEANKRFRSNSGRSER